MLFACHSKDPYQDARKVYEQTMKLHDEVMPKMGEVLSVRHNLKMKLDSVSDPDLKSNIDSAMTALNKTYNDMMQWMADLKPVPDKNSNKSSEDTTDNQQVTDPSQILKIQQESLSRIKDLQIELNKTLQQGHALLKKI